MKIKDVHIFVGNVLINYTNAGLSTLLGSVYFHTHTFPEIVSNVVEIQLIGDDIITHWNFCLLP